MTPYSYDALVERCSKGGSIQYPHIEYVLAEVLRTLETVTPEMVAAWVDERTTEEIAFPTSEEYASASWLAMLRASPLSPP